MKEVREVALQGREDEEEGVPFSFLFGLFLLFLP